MHSCGCIYQAQACVHILLPCRCLWWPLMKWPTVGRGLLVVLRVTRARTASSPAPAPQPAPAPPPAPVPPSPWHAALQAIAANIAPAVCAARRVAVVVLAAAGMVAYAKHVGAQAGAASASPAAVMSHVAADLLPVAIILLA